MKSDALILTDAEQSMMAGEQGAAMAMAMTLLTSYARIVGARRLLEVEQAHIDGCLYHGQASLDFVDRLVSHGGRVAVPTTLNVGSVDLVHPGLVRVQRRDDPRRLLMERHEQLGCRPSFSCAPYQHAMRPGFGQQIAWGESNAVVFANSVIGARTNRYGDFIDLCCAIAGRAPAYGLHLDEHRRGQHLFRLDADCLTLDGDKLYVGIGALIGARAGMAIPVIEGLPPGSEDQLKALGAVAASTGSVGLFHVLGQTPEAPDLRTACGGQEPALVTRLSARDVQQALQHLSTVDEQHPIQALSLGTPHYSLAQLRELARLSAGWAAAPGVQVYCNTSREIWAQAMNESTGPVIRDSGIQPVLDTCVYVTSILDHRVKTLMTDSGKLAHYAPGNLGVRVAFGSLQDCMASAQAGRVVRVTP